MPEDHEKCDRFIAALTPLCPPPGTVRTVRWAAAEEALGTALPTDYKRLVETYGGGVFAGTIWLLEPDCPDPMYDLVAQTAERDEILADLWAAGEKKPGEIEEGGVRLVPWGYVEGAGHFLYWLVRPGAEPEEWTIVLNEGRGPLWEAHPASCSQFLLDVVAGTSTSYYFADIDDMVDPEDRYRFMPTSRFPA
ncbi:SMI1/KNR4 family protein [Streptomyces flavochromogenes]|uniref:SMI1/KNR4 family protein n=1 Tax=Streptomyces flavochromogenes TaxID=68199 RepID=UPI00068E3ED5|nr:SMI1/KNR4 family protein [Streptomyces flavochromogenes]